MTAPAAATPQTAVTSAGTAAQTSTKVAVTESAGTDYVVLRLSEKDGWLVAATIKANTPEAAIKKAHGSGDVATYVAVTARSWKPVRVTPQTVTTLKLEEAK